MAVWDEKLVAVMLPEKKEAILYYSELGRYINNVDTPEGEGRERERENVMMAENAARPHS